MKQMTLRSLCNFAGNSLLRNVEKCSAFGGERETERDRERQRERQRQRQRQRQRERQRQRQSERQRETERGRERFTTLKARLTELKLGRRN